MKVQQWYDSLRAVVVEVRKDAATVRALTGDNAEAAFAYERAADKFEAALVSQGNRLLGAKEAGDLFDRHRDTIRNAINDGRLANYGTKNRPRVSFDELSRAFGGSTVAHSLSAPYDGSTDARSRANARRGH